MLVTVSSNQNIVCLSYLFRDLRRELLKRIW